MGECDVRAASTKMMYSDDARVGMVSMAPPSAMTSFAGGWQPRVILSVITYSSSSDR